MLLSFFSRRTLEADSRDSYGFAIRPQHLQTYKEYGKIYKEEEEQRSEKWSIFLEQCSEFAEPCTSAEEKSETSKSEATTGEGDDSRSEKSRSDSWKEVGSRKDMPVVQETKRRYVKTWEPIRTSLSPIERLMSVCAKKKAYRVNDHVHLVQKSQHPIDREMPTRSNSHNSIQEQFTNNYVMSKENCNAAEAVADSSESKHTSNDSHKNMDSCIVEDSEAKRSANSCSDAIDKLVIHEPFFAWKEELESLVLVGIPKAFRGEIWQAFVGVQTRRVEKYYQNLISTGVDICETKNWRKQIEKDLPRTFPGHPALDEEGRNSLRRILTAYALHNPCVGYCQAMNFFAGLLLLLMPEENAFWTLVGIIDDYFDGYFTQEMIESQVDQLVFDELMRERFPKLVKHLDYLGVEAAWVSGPWFLSIFVNMLPWESVLRVWDVLLFEGNRIMLFRTALAIMELYGPALITTKDAGDAVTLLQSLTGSTFDSSQLVFTACIGFLSVTEARLEELRSKHRPSVLGIIETRNKEKQLSKVASKLYSFSHRQSLRKESSRKEPKRKESLGGKLNGWTGSIAKLSPDNFDEFMCALSIDSESDSVPDLQEQVVRLKAELFQMMEEKRLATLRAEELETAFLEKSKQDDRGQLIAKIEQLEQEVELLRQALADKQEQERATLQVLMRVEQEKKAIESARNAVVQDLDAQKRETSLLQEKYKEAMSTLAEIEKGLTAESMLDGALQYESGDAKAVSSSRGVCGNSLHEGGETAVLSSELGEHDANEGEQIDWRREATERT